MPYEREIEVAQRLAAKAAELALSLQKGIVAEPKADASPVTIADTQSERLIAAGLEEAFPEDGLLGEEGAGKQGSSGRRWIIDPIDGTRDFVRGNFLWAVLIGLEDRGEVKAGVVHMPMLNAFWWASRGGGAWKDGTRVRVSAIDSVSSAVLSLNSLQMMGARFCASVLDTLKDYWAVRSLGGTPDAMLLAEGKLEVWIEPKVAPWDLAAPSIILEEAGAFYSDFTGKRTIYGGNAIAAVPPLAEAARAFARLAQS